nr:MAG TPA: hypothetical protein [Caudoviricetes sp.]
MYPISTMHLFFFEHHLIISPDINSPRVNLYS